MKHLIAALLVAPLLIAIAPAAHADTVTRVTTTTTTDQQCRDFTKTTNYVNRTVTTSGTACLFADGAWHDVTSPGQPIVQYDADAVEPVIVERRPVVYAEPEVVPVPVYYGGYYDHPHHYGYGGPGYYGRGGDSLNIDFRGRL
jgi:hypothetical protein